MQRIRSILWVGRAEGLGADAVAETPALDVAWARDLDDALALPLAAFDALVLDVGNAEEARHGLVRLAAAGKVPPVVVRVPESELRASDTLRAAGAAGVLARGRGTAADADLTKLLDTLHGLAGPSPGPQPSHAAADTPADESVQLGPEGIVGGGPAMRALFALLERAIHSHASVLLSGETGTGKDLLARAIHRGGARQRGAFVAVNCAAFPDTLLESELFGHVWGAFTGADRAKKGLFEVAHGGTLFLDEVGETSPSLQAKLLRALQEREVRPVGGARSRAVDVRLVAATNRNLRTEVVARRFREDLYYRLAVFPIRVPALRERPEDVLPLAELFLRRFGAREGKPGCRLTAKAADLLRAHAWPGNVRELENEIQRALALAEPGGALTPQHFSERVRGALEPVAAGAGGETLRETLDRIEAWLIRRALDAHGGRRAATARSLGITREGLYKKMQRFGIR
jgi:transcriptional regulator with PAS, ATPase and Fis domain